MIMQFITYRSPINANALGINIILLDGSHKDFYPKLFSQKTKVKRVFVSVNVVGITMVCPH